MTVFPAVKVQKKNGRWGIDISSRYPDEWNQSLEKIGDGNWCQVVIKAPEKPATELQNRLFHGLLGLYFKSGIHSFDSYETMRDTVKYRYGVYHHYVIYNDGSYSIIKPNQATDTSKSVLQQGLVLVSWAKYNRKQRTEAIKGLIAEMETAGIMQTGYANDFLEIISEQEA